MKLRKDTMEPRSLLIFERKMIGWLKEFRLENVTAPQRLVDEKHLFKPSTSIQKVEKSIFSIKQV